MQFFTYAIIINSNTTSPAKTTKTYDNIGQKYGRFATLFTRNSPYFFPFRPPCIVHRTRSGSKQLTASAVNLIYQ